MLYASLLPGCLPKSATFFFSALAHDDDPVQPPSRLGGPGRGQPLSPFFEFALAKRDESEKGEGGQEAILFPPPKTN